MHCLIKTLSSVPDFHLTFSETTLPEHLKQIFDLRITYIFQTTSLKDPIKGEDPFFVLLNHKSTILNINLFTITECLNLYSN